MLIDWWSVGSIFNFFFFLSFYCVFFFRSFSIFCCCRLIRFWYIFLRRCFVCCWDWKTIADRWCFYAMTSTRDKWTTSTKLRQRVSIKEWLYQSHNSPNPEILSEIIVISILDNNNNNNSNNNHWEIQKQKRKCSMGRLEKSQRSTIDC